MNLKSGNRILYVSIVLAMMAGGVSTASAENSSNVEITQQRDHKIQGRVVDENGEPLIGVSVLVQGTGTGAATDIDGHFAINADPGATLRVTYIGYLPKTIKATGKPMMIVLQEDNKSLDDVVVVGYGSMKKKLLTGATVQVKGGDIQKLNTTSPLQALQGQAPGVSITSTSGQPGEDMKVYIRGIGTTGDSQPLYIIDGVGGDITSLNPADIESIDVLKDAASCAIYGSAGANGVVLVTTKSGNYNQRAQVTFDGYMGWQSAARKSNLLNAQEYKTIMDEAAVNSGNSPYDWSSYKDIYDANGNPIDTDWASSMFKNNVKTESYSLGINGGTNLSKYNMTLGYMSQGGIVGGKDKSGYSRYNFRINTEHKVFKNSDLLTVGEQVSFIYKQNNGIGVGNAYNNTIRGAFNTSPLSPIYDADGNLNDTSNSDWVKEDGNPYGVMQMTCNNKTKNANFNGNIYAELQPIKNLKIRTVFGAVYNSSDYRSWSPTYTFSKYSYNDKEKVSQSAYNGLGLTWTNTASYSWMWNEHAFNVLAGMEAYRYSGTSVSANQATLKDGYSDWEHAYVSNGTAGTTGDGLGAYGSPANESKKVSYFGRIGWNWKERYMINATVRRDYSSNFASGHRGGTFPSVSGGWTITNEDFMEQTKSWLDFLKLRISWGQVGNSNIDPYQYLSPVTTANTHYFFGNDLTSISSNLASNYGAYSSRLATEDLHWETSEQFNVGFDTRLLDSRLGVNFDFYIKNTKDWLVMAPIANLADDYAPVINGGSVKNTGVELAVSWNDNIGKDFTYGVSVNGAYNKNKVGEIPTSDGIIHGATGSVLYDNSGEFYRAQQGHALGYFWGYKTAGIFQNQTDIENWIKAGNGVLQADVQPGDVKYVDVDHNGVIDDNDKVDLGNGHPKFTFGFNINLGYKHFDFNITANGACGQKIVQSYRNQTNKFANYTTAILQRWTGEGTSNTMPRVTLENINWQFSDLYIQDGDYLRISNITLGYDFAHLWNCKAVSQARLYFQVQNAFTFTKYDGLDPELGYGDDSWVSGIDYGYYPRPRTFLVGVNLKF